VPISQGLPYTQIGMSQAGPRLGPLSTSQAKVHTGWVTKRHDGTAAITLLAGAGRHAIVAVIEDSAHQERAIIDPMLAASLGAGSPPLARFLSAARRGDRRENA